MPANHVEDYINALSTGQLKDCFDEIFLLVIDAMIGPARFGKSGFLRAADGGEDLRPGLLGDLNGDIAYAASAAVNQNRFAGLKRMAVK